MKTPIPLHIFSAFLACLFTCGIVSADIFVNVEFASSETDSMVDQLGQDLITGDSESSTSNFVFQLGSFANNFQPTDANTSSWFENWRVFDVADFAILPPPLIGISGGLTESGTSAGTHEDVDTDYVFSGQQAYLWIYNGTSIQEPNTEWFLGRADNWTFPTIDPDPEPCEECPGPDPVQWALSQLTSTDIPVWGGQSGIRGFGEYGFTEDDFTLQTFIIPEPGTWMLVFIAFGGFGFSLLIRRKGEKS